MQHEEGYKGHQIVVDTTKQGKGYRWSYVIDGVTFRQGKERPLKSEEIMLHEGIREAKAEVDRM